MKKMRNGRRGFTLLEIVIVVAIIVILSAGAFLGVAATVNRASEAQEQLAVNNGENFEAYARNQVDSYGKDMVYWDPIPNYTPENQAKKMKEQMLAEGWTDGEITFEYHEDGWHIVAEWDPTIPEHRGFQTPEDYKLWLSNYNNYIALGYTKEEIEKGCKDGSTEINAIWNPDNHGGMTYEQYVESQKPKDPVNPVVDDKDKTVVDDKDKTPTSDPVVVGAITVPSGYNNDMQNGTGVTKVTNNGGGSYSIDVHTSSNAATITVVPKGDGYSLTITSNMQWMLNGMPSYSPSSGYNDFAKTREITQEDWEWIQKQWGFEMG